MLYHIRKINGVVPPVPTELKMTRFTLDLDSHRTASGQLQRNPVAKKMKFELKFPPTDKPQMTSILQMLDSEKFIVEYEDMFNGQIKTGYFYHGDIAVDILKVRGTTNENVWFNPFSISLIEY